MPPVHDHVHDPVKLKRKSEHAQGRVYSLRFGPPDGAYDVLEKATDALPSSVNLLERPYMPPVLDQGSLGSCASNAMAVNIGYLLGKESKSEFLPSRLALYYNCRVKVEGAPADQDTGVTIADLCQAVAAYHACPEADWPYDISKFALPPPEKATKDEMKHRGWRYFALEQELDTIKTSLAQGYPVILGIQIYTSFESQAVAETGLVPIPNVDTEQLLGGHCQLIIGYSDEKQAFLSRNSWSKSWGCPTFPGCSWIPYKYILDPTLTSDIWSVRYFA
jgi:C1A family cysteine protease